MGYNDDDGLGNGNSKGNGNGDGNNDNNANGGNGEGKCSNDRRSNDGSNDDGSKDFSDVGVRPIRNIDLNCLDAASTKANEERELMLLQAAAHIKMARAQRALYQPNVADAVADATARKEHSVRRYTFVVDYRQNMELPVYNKDQPDCTYYFSPLSVYNLEMINHAHIYDDGQVSEHLHSHVYTEGVGRKGANSVALLIMKHCKN
jgi:hypothetical protein